MEARTKFEEFLHKLQALKIKQKNLDWEEDIPEDIMEELENLGKQVSTRNQVEKHRWYELSTTVYSIHNSFLGIKHIYDIYSENMSCSDIFHTLEFCEMKELTTVYYVNLS